MSQYVFILGRNPELSAAEIKAVLPQAKVILENDSFLILEISDEVLKSPPLVGSRQPFIKNKESGQVQDDKQGCQELLNRLGGTIKIGKIIGQKITADTIAEEIQQMGSRIHRHGGASKSGTTSKKINFGLSYYNCPKDDLGMAVKKELKQAGISSRLVTSREKTLSSVVVTKNKCQEFLILGNNNVALRPAYASASAGRQAQDDKNRWLAKTCAVQEFEDYSARDYGRPVRDLVSGSLPPKLAQIMINLAQAPTSAKILDPFCGSGTILQEAILMGYEKLVGSDKSNKAIEDTKKNLEWLGRKFEIRNSKFEILQADVSEIGSKVQKVDAVITEPYLGPALRGGESREQIEKIVSELESLYLKAFAEFAKILSPRGKIVIIFPWFKQFNLTLNIFDQIKKLGFNQLDKNDLVYGRPDQRVFRRIYIFTKY